MSIDVAAAEPALKYPTTKKVDQVDDHHGTKVADPYRWLEDDVRESKDVAAWVEAQNKVTFGYLEQIPERGYINERITELWNFEKFSAPSKRGGRYYYSHNSGLQNQYVLYVQDSLDGEARVLMDPNTWSDDGTVALAGTAFSDDGNYVAYGVQDAGSDWRSTRAARSTTNCSESSSTRRSGQRTAKASSTPAIRSPATMPSSRR